MAPPAPIMPPAPARFSMMTDWPRICCMIGATRRAVTSVLPPGANGTMILIGSLGKLCPHPAPGCNSSEAKSETRQATATRRKAFSSMHTPSSCAPAAWPGEHIPNIGSFSRASPLRPLARPLQELLEQALLLGRIVRRCLCGLRLCPGQVDAGRRRRLAPGSRFRGLPVEPLLRRMKPRPAANCGREVDGLPAWVTRRLPQLVELREERIHELLELSIALGARRPVVADEDSTGRNGWNLCALCNQVRVGLARQACRQVGRLVRREIGDLQELEAQVGAEAGPGGHGQRAETHGRVDLPFTHQVYGIVRVRIDFLDLDAGRLQYLRAEHVGGAALD